MRVRLIRGESQFCRRKSLWIFPEYWWVAAQTILQAKKSLNNSMILIICGSGNFAGEKVFGYFQDIDEVRLSHFCRRKSLWIFPGHWWVAAKTISQAKNSLNIFSPRWWWDWAKTSSWIVWECFLSKDWALRIRWDESVGEFRPKEVGQLTVGSGWIKWESTGSI